MRKSVITILTFAALFGSAQLEAENAVKATHLQTRMAAGSETTEENVRATENSLSRLLPERSSSDVQTPKTEAAQKVVAKTIANPPTIYGTFLYSKGLNPGMYQIPLNGEDFVLKISGIKTSYGAVLVNGKYYFPVYDSSSKTTMMYVYDIKTFTLEKSYAVSNDILASAITYDPTTDAIYGNFYGDEFTTSYYGIAHLESGRVTKISQKNKAWSAMATDEAGTVYAITTDGIVYSVKKATGALSTIGSTDVTSKYVTGGVYDNSSKQIFWAVSDDNGGYMYTVNPSTAAATLVTTFPTEEEVSGLVIPNEATNVPAQPSNATVTFEPSSLTGTVSFTAPTTTVDGNSASGDLSYAVYANGQSLASGTTTYGATVSLPVTVSASGTYTFSIFTSNANGRGYSARVEQYVGVDVPVTPTVTASYDESSKSIIVKWDKITAGANGGYLDPSTIRYTVTRYPDATVVAQDIDATTYTDSNYGTGTIFYYTVVATSGSVQSEAGKSNKVQTNIQYTPYIENFDTKADFTNNFTGIFSGKGDNGWYYNTKNKCIRAYYDFDYPKDEWLMTPPIKLEKGKKYRFSVDFKGGDDEYTEKFEILYGKENTVEGMTNVLFKKADYNEEDWITLTNYIEPDETGIYYIGFHACSDEDQDYIYLDNLFISAETSDNAPAGITNIAVARDQSGSNKATISMKTPTTDISGKTITSLSKVEIYQSKSLIATIASPECGSSVSTDIEVESPGTYDFMAVAYNESGMGAIARKSAYVGIQAPKAPTNAKIAETETLGTVLLTWDAPATDTGGITLTPDKVTYTIATSEGVIKTGLSDTQCLVKVCEPEEQGFVKLYVYAVTAGGTSASSAATDMICVGSPYTLPFNESFAGGKATTAIGSELVSGRASWQYYKDTSVDGGYAQDGDNGYASFTATKAGSIGDLYLGKIKIEDQPNVALTFYTFPVGTLSLNVNTLDVQVDDGSGFKSAKKIVMNDLKISQKWVKVVVPMTDYAGKTVRIKFEATDQKYVYTFIDNIYLGTIKALNIGSYSLEAPDIVNTDESFSVVFNVANEGLKDANYNVELYRNNELIKTAAVAEHKSSDIEVVTFEDNLTRLDEAVATYQAKIVCEGNESDATVSETVVTTQNLDILPTVEDLSAQSTGESVTLNWTEPNTSNAVPDLFTDTFENYTSWEYQNIGNWTLVDNDKAKIGGFKNYSFPNIPEPNSGTLAFFILDSSWETISSITEYAPYSGTKYLASIFNYNSEANDDWAISPLLYGGKQIISLYAKSFNSTYLESFEILYSTTDTNIESFKSLKSYNQISSDWTKYSVVLPDGAKYFAIRYTSTDRLLICIDDVSFIPTGSPRTLNIEGYNIYRDKVKITETPVKATTYSDVLTDKSSHRYNVTCVYSQGESAGSNTVEAATSGVVNVTNSEVTVKVINHGIYINGANDKFITVYSTDGQSLFADYGQLQTVVNIYQPGIYIVKVDSQVFKVIVP